MLLLELLPELELELLESEALPELELLSALELLLELELLPMQQPQFSWTISS